MARTLSVLWRRRRGAFGTSLWPRVSFLGGTARGKNKGGAAGLNPCGSLFFFFSVVSLRHLAGGLAGVFLES
jgi:hypothetical protein